MAKATYNFVNLHFTQESDESLGDLSKRIMKAYTAAKENNTFMTIEYKNGFKIINIDQIITIDFE